MRTLFLLIVFIGILAYFVVPNDMKNEYLEKAGIEFKFDEPGIEFSNNSVTEHEFKKDMVSIAGDTANGRPMTDTSWGTKPHVGCYTKTNAEKFSGKYNMHKVQLDKSKTIDITFEDKTDNNELSIVVFKVKPNLDLDPSSLSYAHACTSKLSSDKEKGSITMKGDSIRSEIYVIISGNKDLEKGEYTLSFTQK